MDEVISIYEEPASKKIMSKNDRKKAISTAKKLIKKIKSELNFLEEFQSRS